MFTNILDHINAVCLTFKSTDIRFHPLVKYIFADISSNFTEDIAENLIFLSTHANRDTIKKCPYCIENIEVSSYFSSTNQSIDKIWYSFDSKYLFDEEDINTKFTKYCYEQICKLYEKIKELNPKKTRKMKI